MSLGNWAVLAVDQYGRKCDGKLFTPGNRCIQIYKNWLFLFDETHLRKHGAIPAAEPREILDGAVVYTMVAGALQFGDLSILAVRGPHDGVYVACWTGEPDETGFDAMIGCGVYGYGPPCGTIEPEKWIGVGSTARNFLRFLIGEQFDECGQFPQNDDLYLPDELIGVPIHDDPIPE